MLLLATVLTNKMVILTIYFLQCTCYKKTCSEKKLSLCTIYLLSIAVQFVIGILLSIIYGVLVWKYLLPLKRESSELVNLTAVTTAVCNFPWWAFHFIVYTHHGDRNVNISPW